MSRTGINVVRRTSGGPASRNIFNHIAQNMMTQGQPPTLQRAVVVDVICDPSILNDEYLNFIAGVVDNPELVAVLPINSVIARIVSNQGGLAPSVYTILFPFWSSHIQTPIKPGEQVYVIYEDYENSGYKAGFWLTRGMGQQTIEDANYTHLDRRFDNTLNIDNYTITDRNNLQREALPPIGFPNGGGTIDTYTITPNENMAENPYDVIIRNASSTRYLTFEPVPRWKKRPQELILQGSNNSLIVLGEDRNGPIAGAIQENPIDFRGQAGSIDLVSGRGRFLPQPGQDPRMGGGSENPPGDKNTAPYTTQNAGNAARGTIETDKATFRTAGLPPTGNTIEGDPSPKYDAARVYIVQQSMVDVNYRLVNVNGEGITYPANTIAVTQPAGNGKLGKSYVVNKADNIRIIGRKDQDSGINGTVLIIREGQADTDLAYMYMNEQGYTQLEAPKIYLGKSFPEQEPYIRYTVYRDTINNLQEQINALKNCIDLLLGSGGTVTQAFVNNIASPYSPVASLTAAGAAVPSIVSTMDTTIGTNSGRIPNLLETAKSNKIYGE